MRVRLFTRLFLAIFLSLLIPLGAMMVSIQWHFRQGFSNYLHEVQLERLGKLSGLLAQYYQQQGGWETLRGNRPAWIELLIRARGEASADTPEPDDPADFMPPPPPDGGPPPHRHPYPPPPEGGPHPPHGPPPPLARGFFSPGLRVRLLDASHRHVVGPPPRLRRVQNQDASSSSDRLPITVDDTTVGWLELERDNLITDRLALAFLTQQSRTNLLALALALAVAAIAALILARQILRPLRRIAAGTRRLASGDYTAAIPVTQDELGDLARDFNLLSATLQRNELARRQWIADISHELRTPLAVLRGEIEALHDGIRQPSPARIESLHAEVLALGKLVDDLYELSLSDLGALSYRREALDLGKVLQDAVDGFRHRFTAKGIALEARLDQPAPLHGDRQRLTQLFTNLLENSFRHTNPGGACRIGLATAADTVTVTIEDSVPGVPAEALEHLFERLYRVDASRSREHGGAGLGLAICRNIVAAHHGRIVAEPSALGGLLIRIELPRPISASGAP